jgi:hypothetical protein
MMELMGNEILLCKPELMCFLGIIAQGFSPGKEGRDYQGSAVNQLQLGPFFQG